MTDTKAVAVVEAPPQEADKANNSAPKRMVFVTGDKGGVGKSAFSRFLLDVYITRKVPCRAIDSDPANPDLFRYYKEFGPEGVEKIDFSMPGNADILVDMLPEQQGVVLIDLPARAQTDIIDFFKQVRLVEQAERFNYLVTFCCVMSKDKRSVQVIEELEAHCGGSVDYIPVRNLCFGRPDDFHRYENSEIRKKILGVHKGVEVNMIELFYTSWDAIAEKDLPFRFAANTANSPLSLTQTGRTQTWLEEMEEQIKPAHHLLGL